MRIHITPNCNCMNTVMLSGTILFQLYVSFTATLFIKLFSHFKILLLIPEEKLSLPRREPSKHSPPRNFWGNISTFIIWRANHLSEGLQWNLKYREQPRTSFSMWSCVTPESDSLWVKDFLPFDQKREQKTASVLCISSLFGHPESVYISPAPNAKEILSFSLWKSIFQPTNGISITWNSISSPSSLNILPIWLI